MLPRLLSFSSEVVARVAYRIRELDANSERELDTVTRMCMNTVLDTIPEFAHDEERARKHLPNFTFEQMREMIRADLHKPTHRFLVAVAEDGRIVGHSMFSRRKTPDGRRFGYFFSRYVEPAHRRKGIGASLMTQALAWFEEDRPDFLVAHTHATNEPLRRLFEQHGFRVVERHDKPWPSLTLRRDLGPVAG
jgi:ribosomal protein S18 acetylase RimI-like enzyme